MTRWSEEDLAIIERRLSAPLLPVYREPKPAKYRNVKTDLDGFRFDSRLEARCYAEQKLRQASGEVLWFTRQVPFWLEGGVVYRADFVCILAAGGADVIDATGRATPAKTNKLKQVRARYGITVILWTDRS